MKKGTVKFFDEAKGYGFIKEEGTEKEYFVHISGVNNNTILNQDDDVSFELVEGRKGLNAVNVELV